LAAPGDDTAQVELTHNWDPQAYDGGRNFGHLAYAVDDIYAAVQRLMDHGVTINRPPRDGHMAFVRSPDNISIDYCSAARPSIRPSPGSACRTSGFGKALYWLRRAWPQVP
jgi:lactoylglutathione lyase